LAILDLGLSQAMNREMARLSVDQENAKLMADTARTLELVYWLIALGVAAVIILLSDFIAYHWLNPEQLSRSSLRQALWIMALVIGLRWPVAVYTGGLNGLQRQVLVNLLWSGFATLQGAGALMILWLVEPSIQAFFLWQALIALLQVLALRVALWRSGSLKRSRGRFRKEVLRNIWRFAAGMSGIALASTILTQLDKVLLSKMLSLADFGYYTFAATVAGVIFRIIGPVFTAYYPRLTELVSRDDQLGLVKTYHQGCQLMAIAILPSAFVLALFSKEILELWTRNSDIATHSFLLVSLLVVGNSLNGLMHIPYALQLAHGWTKLAFYQNVIAVIALVPAIYLATLEWGGVGAAVVWVILNSSYFLISIQLMHRRILMSEKWYWYWNDVIKPLVVILVVVGMGKFAALNVEINMLNILILFAAFVLATMAGIASMKSLRGSLFHSLERTRG
jgi:O-antigen/teichoic acid export membrane protein